MIFQKHIGVTLLRPLRLHRPQRIFMSRRHNSTETPSTSQIDTTPNENPPTESELPDLSELSEPELAATIVYGRSYRPAYQHPKTHGIPVASIHFRSFDIRQLDLATHFTTHVAAALAVPCSKTVYLPTQRSLWTVIRGPFAHKKSQENFDRKVHKRCIKAWDADQEVVDNWLQYLQTYPVDGVTMRITRWYRVPLDFGKEYEIDKSTNKELELKSSRTQIEEIAAMIIKKETAAAAEAAMLDTSSSLPGAEKEERKS